MNQKDQLWQIINIVFQIINHTVLIIKRHFHFLELKKNTKLTVFLFNNNIVKLMKVNNNN
jgi:hypothetical protein